MSLSGCGGGSGSDPEPPVVAPPVTVTAPAISAQPAAATVVDGQAASFTVSATGTAPLTYQWQRNGANISGATSASYALPAVTLTDTGARFQVLVSNSAGSATSAAVVLTVNPAATAPSIATQPVSTTVVAGSPANLHVQASGTAPLAYQWQRNGASIVGATAAAYSLTATTLADSGANFNVIVSNTIGSVTSAAALLTVVEALALPTLAAQPQSSSTLDGSPISLSVGVTGTGPFSYQWRRNGAALAGAISANYTSPALTLADTGALYSVVVGNGAGSVTSTNATVTVNPMPVALSTQPANVAVLSGQTATFTVVATGSAPIAYQWRRNGAAIAGATTNSYTTPATAVADSGAAYTVLVSNAANSATSNAALLNVTAAPVAATIETQPANASVAPGQTATFGVVASGTPAPAYQWQVSTNGGSTWANISAAAAANYTTGSLALADNGLRLRVVVSNSSGSVTSQTALLSVVAPPSVLAGRAWSTGQSLETDDRSVIASTVAIDDAGNATSVFIKSNGTRNVLYATRGVPGSTGTAAAWSAPLAIDSASLPATTSGFTVETPVMAIAPNGNALVIWGTTGSCTASTYSTNLSARCNFLAAARYDAANNVWSPPAALADTPNFAPAIQAFINSRGDFALLYPGWARSGTSGYTARMAVLWQGQGQTAVQRNVFNDATLNLQTLGMDKDGNLLVAGSANQNSTTDVVAYRGTLAAGFGAQEVLDQRGAAASFQRAAVGLNGQAVVVWTQNNGTVGTRYAADLTTASGAWSVREMEPSSNSYAFATVILTVTDSGAAIYGEYSNGSCAPYFHRLSGGTWSALTRFPSGYAGCNWSAALNRNGDVVQFSGAAWGAYDATSNSMVRMSTSGTTSVYGTTGGSLGDGSFALSVNGMGVLTVAVPYDTLPTAAQPAGDGRSAVTNLWGLFLK